MTIVATLKDGRVIAKANITTVDRSGAGKVFVQATLTDLKTVETVLQTNFNVTPNTNATVEQPTISGNVVGVTVYCGAGTTISGEVVGIGF